MREQRGARRALRWMTGSAAFGAGCYAGVAATAWWRYGRPRRQAMKPGTAILGTLWNTNPISRFLSERDDEGESRTPRDGEQGAGQDRASGVSFAVPGWGNSVCGIGPENTRHVMQRNTCAP